MFDWRSLLQFAKENNASDVHLGAGEKPIVRIYKDIRRIDHKELENEEVFRVIKHVLKDETKLDKLMEQMDIDHLFADPELGRFRVNVYRTLSGFAINFRIIPDKIPTPEELGLPSGVKALTKLERGLVLVTGPTSSGKSTTLASIVAMINNETQKHILTIEDPVEHIHIPNDSLINHREVGSNTKSFARALKSALREDPDVIIIGEMRDIETISLALTAAETGNLVIGTLHTTSTAKTITRIIDAFPPSKQKQIRIMLSESIQMVLSQVLMKKQSEPGLIAAYELMLASVPIKSLIRENKIHQIPSILETSGQAGMITLDKSIENLIKNGQVSLEEGLKYAQNKAELIKEIKG